MLPHTPGLTGVIVVEDGSDLSFAGVEYEAALAEQSPERDFDERSSDDLYILYTDGTTGADVPPSSGVVRAVRRFRSR